MVILITTMKTKAIDLIKELYEISNSCIQYVSAFNHVSRAKEAEKRLAKSSDDLWEKASKIDNINKDLLEALQEMLPHFRKLTITEIEIANKAKEAIEKAIS